VGAALESTAAVPGAVIGIIGIILLIGIVKKRILEFDRMIMAWHRRNETSPGRMPAPVRFSTTNP
jgi:ABC-type phosphate transport system permease subunit